MSFLLLMADYTGISNFLDIFISFINIVIIPAVQAKIY